MYFLYTNFVFRANDNNCYIQILETAFKKETVGLVTREQYVEKVIRQFLYTSVFAGTFFYFASNLLSTWWSRGLTFEPRSRRKRKRNFRSCNKSEFELRILAWKVQSIAVFFPLTKPWYCLSQRRRIANAEKEKEESEGWSTLIFLWRHWKWKWWRWFWESYAPSNLSVALLLYYFLTSFMDLCRAYLFTFLGTICSLLHWTRLLLCFTTSLLVCGEFFLIFQKKKILA